MPSERKTPRKLPSRRGGRRAGAGRKKQTPNATPEASVTDMAFDLLGSLERLASGGYRRVVEPSGRAGSASLRAGPGASNGSR